MGRKWKQSSKVTTELLACTEPEFPAQELVWFHILTVITVHSDVFISGKMLIFLSHIETW